MAGAEDAPYVAAAGAMAAALPDARVVVLSGVGHAVVGEAPAELAAAVGEFLGS